MSQLPGVEGEGPLFTPPRVFYYRLNSRGMLGWTNKQPDYRSVFFFFLTSACGKSITNQLASFLSSFAIQKYTSCSHHTIQIRIEKARYDTWCDTSVRGGTRPLPIACRRTRQYSWQVVNSSKHTFVLHLFSTKSTRSSDGLPFHLFSTLIALQKYRGTCKVKNTINSDFKIVSMQQYVTVSSFLV